MCRSSMTHFGSSACSSGRPLMNSKIAPGRSTKIYVLRSLKRLRGRSEPEVKHARRSWSV